MFDDCALAGFGELRRAILTSVTKATLQPINQQTL